MRTFTLSNAESRQFCKNQNLSKPTKHQVKSDKEARQIVRELAKKMLRRTGFESDAIAIRMAEQCYGVNDIYARTGVDRRILRKLVLGE